MLASTWLDMVLGVDIHFEMVPTPALVPVPIPNPFIGMVFDPAGLLIGLGLGAAMSLAFGGPVTGPVMINGIPATNVGTNAKGMGHFLFPPGTMWAPMPKFPKPSFKEPPTFPGPPVKPEDDAIAIQGSQTVNIMGASGVRMGEMFMSCGEPLRAPSSGVIAIPKGAPVLVGGPPAVNLMTALTSMIKTKWVAGYLHSLLSRMAPGRLQSILKKGVCLLTGHPVDVANGRVLTDHVDWELPGPIPLTFERCYSSAWAKRFAPLGHGWSHSLDQALWTERGKVVYLAGDGREIEFDTFDLPNHSPSPGVPVFEPINQLTLTVDGHGGAVIVDGEGLRHEFGTVAGSSTDRRAWLRLRRITNRTGHQLQLEYDVSGNLAWVRDSAGRVVNFEHDSRGRLVLVKVPHPTEQGWLPHTRFAYDGNDDLVQATDPLGHSWRFTYKQHLLVQETDRNGLSFFFAYDGYGANAYCVRTWGDGGIYDHAIDYDKKGKVTFVTNSLGETTVYHMNPIGLVTKVVDPLGAETRYEYDESNLRRIKVALPDGSERKWRYDTAGRLTAVVAADGALLELAYDQQGNLISAKMPTGGVWAWHHDAKGRVSQRIDPLGQITRYEYDAHTGLLSSMEDGLGRSLTLRYDAEFNTTEVVLADGTACQYAHDRLGRVTVRTGANSVEERFFYDALDRLLRVDVPLRAPRIVEYDPEGCPLRIETGTRTVDLGYTGMRRVARRREAESTIVFRYDSEDRISAVENEAGETLRFQRDLAGRVTHRWDFDGSLTELTLDTVGRVVATKQPSGSSIATTCDAMGRPTRVLFSDGSERSFVYRADGLLTKATNLDQVVELERDLLGRVVRERQGSHWVDSTFDARGRRVKIRSSLGLEVRMARGPRGFAHRLDLRLDKQAWSAEFEHDGAGLEVLRRIPGAIARTERDGIGRPIHQTVAFDGQPPVAWSHHWNVQNRLENRIDSTKGPTSFQRDKRGQLVEVTAPDGEIETLARDSVGNPFDRPDRNDRKYGPGGRLFEWKGQPATHDADGRLIELTDQEGHGWRYDYASTGELKSVFRPDGEKIEFNYDALGRRVGKASSTGKTTWIWDGGVPIHESSNTGTVTWVFEPNSMDPLARITRDDHLGVIRDYLGTPRYLVEGSGKAQSIAVDAHGRLRDVGGIAALFPWRFAGQYADAETGLNYNRYRYYHPDLGRYLTKDPLGPFGNLNAYAYVGDPTASTDPFGLIEEWGVAPYGASTHTGDGLDAHELLQSAWLKENAPGYEGRSKGIGRQNPAMGIDPDIHDSITAAQREKGLLNSEVLAGQTAAENIAKNAEILKAEMIANGMSPKEAAKRVRDMKKESEAYAESVGCK